MDIPREMVEGANVMKASVLPRSERQLHSLSAQSSFLQKEEMIQLITSLETKEFQVEDILKLMDKYYRSQGIEAIQESGELKQISTTGFMKAERWNARNAINESTNFLKEDKEAIISRASGVIEKPLTAEEQALAENFIKALKTTQEKAGNLSEKMATMEITTTNLEETIADLTALNKILKNYDPIIRGRMKGEWMDTVTKIQIGTEKLIEKIGGNKEYQEIFQKLTPDNRALFRQNQIELYNQRNIYLTKNYVPK